MSISIKQVAENVFLVREYSDEEGVTLRSNKGIRALEYKARQEFEIATGIWFPWQLTATSGYGAFGHDYARWYTWRECSLEEHLEELERAARYAGWLKAAEALPGIRRMLAHGMTARGLNSPYHYFTADDLAVKWPSPHRLERTVWRVRREAREVLRDFGYTGANPSWVDTGRAVLFHRRPRRAALALAALTMVHGGATRVYTWGEERPTWRWVQRTLVDLSLSKTRGEEHLLADGSRLWKERVEVPTRGGAGYRWVAAWRFVAVDGTTGSIPMAAEATTIGQPGEWASSVAPVGVTELLNLAEGFITFRHDRAAFLVEGAHYYVDGDIDE